MSHYRDILDAEAEERMALNNRRDKIYIEESLKRIQEFQRCSYTNGIQHELASIEKFYKSKLYDLRHIAIDSESV